jgi:hypothetical protein
VVFHILTTSYHGEKAFTRADLKRT